MPGTGQQAGSPRRAPLSPGSGSPASPGHSRHEDAAPPPVQNVFLGPCPGIRPGISSGISPGSTGGGSAGRCHLGSEDTGHCPSPPTPAGLWAAWPVPALPCSPSRPQGTLWPQTQPSSGRKGRRKPLAPFGCSPQPGPAGDTPLAPPWLGGHWSPNPPGVHSSSPAEPPAAAAPGGLGCLWVPRVAAAPPWHSPALAGGLWPLSRCPPGLPAPTTPLRGPRLAPQPVSQPPGQSPPRAQVLLIFKSFCNKSF